MCFYCGHSNTVLMTDEFAQVKIKTVLFSSKKVQIIMFFMTSKITCRAYNHKPVTRLFSLSEPYSIKLDVES